MSYKENGFPISKGRVNMTSGSVAGLLLCVEDGAINVTWDDDSTAVISMVAGDAINFSKAKSAVIDSGSYHGA